MEQQYQKILVAVTGMSPQVLTETIYALYKDKQWIPDEVHVLTTAMGAANIRDTLLGKGGYLQKLIKDYHLSPIVFDESHIHVIKDNQQQPLADIRTPEQNSEAADMIMQFMFNLCKLANTQIHVSIAGGRKSMGFYIGYALSLFGRPQDSLSHVLVEEAFEQNPEFFYPSVEKQLVHTARSGCRDASTAKVMLADIPFVRIRQGMPNLSEDKLWHFSDIVAQTQKDLTVSELKIYPSEQKIMCAGMEIRLTWQQFAVYWAMAELRLQNKQITKSVSMPEDEKILANQYIKCYFSSAKARQECQDDIEIVQKRMRADIWRILQECRSKIHKKLDMTLGTSAEQYYIESKGKNHQKLYMLGLDSSAISIVTT
ncbi:CRISPR-associated ring nuclease Csm6 [Pelistega sp. MC2]|uniref:CRISPR-associated ring nuclease Csm6 n=1 Tax=Pelistega sp. MC2 TaxID=1720297 RepID=UPI0008D94ECA|nr:CRISPR-associated ring nuclease Csm6 [Pelistega sp. MC2]